MSVPVLLCLILFVCAVILGVLLVSVPTFGAYSELRHELRRTRESNLLVQQENLNLTDRLMKLHGQAPIDLHARQESA